MTPRKPLPSQRRLRELFDYHEDGYLVRLIDVNPAQVGCRAGDEVRGTTHTGGYLRIMIANVRYLLHRVIFKWHHGWCPNMVDHFPDRDKHNCRIGNLRPATAMESEINKGLQRNNTTGVRGVSLWNGKYMARYKRGGLSRFLGCFDTVEEANEAIERATA